MHLWTKEIRACEISSRFDRESGRQRYSDERENGNLRREKALVHSLPRSTPSFPVYMVACKRYSTKESEIPRLPGAALTFHVRRYVYTKSI